MWTDSPEHGAFSSCIRPSPTAVLVGPLQSHHAGALPTRQPRVGAQHDNRSRGPHLRYPQPLTVTAPTYRASATVAALPLHSPCDSSSSVQVANALCIDQAAPAGVSLLARAHRDRSQPDCTTLAAVAPLVVSPSPPGAARVPERDSRAPEYRASDASAALPVLSGDTPTLATHALTAADVCAQATVGDQRPTTIRAVAALVRSAASAALRRASAFAATSLNLGSVVGHEQASATVRALLSADDGVRHLTPAVSMSAYNTTETLASPATRMVTASPIVSSSVHPLPTRVSIPLFRTTVDLPTPSHPPAGAYVDFPSSCVCGAALRWSPAAAFAQCPTCPAVVPCFVGAMPPPASPTPPPQPRVTLTSEVSPGPPARVTVADHRWSAVRFLSHSRDFVSVASGLAVIAVLPYRLACLMRVLIITALSPIPSHLINENDVAAMMVAWVRNPMARWPSVTNAHAFPGDHHEFAPFDYYCEPGYLRPAYIPRWPGQPHFADPMGSAYLNISQLGSPLSYQFFIHCGHPHAAYIANCVRFGFPSMSPPLGRSTWSYNVPIEPQHLLRARQLVAREFDIGAFVDTSKWPRSVPRRRAPYFFTYSPEKDKLRPVGHFSFGDDAVNKSTDRRALPRALLGQLKQLVKHVLYWKQLNPGETVFVFKFDADNAFRWWPIPAREFAQMVHRVFGMDVANTRLAMGAVASADHMSWGPTVAAQGAFAVFGTRAVSYIDDAGVASPRHRVWFDVIALRLMWHIAGIPFSDKKWESEGLPSTTKLFLGTVVDTENMTVSLPEQKRDKLIASLRALIDDPRSVTDREFRSLAGSLTFAAAVIPMARAFNRAFFTAAYYHGEPPQSLLDLCVRDALWWVDALITFNGSASFRPPTPLSIAFHVASDACKRGWGILVPELGLYAQGAWTPQERINITIAMLEGLTAVMGVAELAPLATGRILVFHTDSWASFKAFAGQRAHNALMYLLMRFVSLVQLRFRVLVVWRHRIGLHNGGPDELSRKEKPPRWTDSYQSFAVRPSVRTLGGISDWPWREQASPTSSHASLLLACSILTTIVNTLDTPSPSSSHMPWIPSKSTLLDDPLFKEDSLISQAISFGARDPRLVARCGDTWARCKSTGLRFATGRMQSPPSPSPSSHDGISFPLSADSECQLPRPSSAPSSTTSPSISLSAPPSSQLSTVLSDVQNTLQCHVQRMTRPSHCSARTSGSATPCRDQRLPSSSVSPKPTTPTPGNGSGSLPPQTSTTASTPGCTATSSQLRCHPATLTMRPCLSAPVAEVASSLVPTSQPHCASTVRRLGLSVTDCRATPSGLVRSSKCATRAFQCKPSRLWRGGRRRQHHR